MVGEDAFQVDLFIKDRGMGLLEEKQNGDLSTCSLQIDRCSYISIYIYILVCIDTTLDHVRVFRVEELLFAEIVEK